MGLFEQFPYQNFHELNLDWLIQQLNLVKESVVLSVNGQTGEVILYPEAFVRLPDLSDTTTWSFYRYADSQAEGIQFINGQPMQRIDGLNRYDVFDSGNPPPYPVTAVNGQTGDVVISVPVQSVNGMTGNIILYQNASIEFPAINTESWEMWRETDTNNALGIKFATGQPIKRVDNGLEYNVYDSQNQPPYPVESVAGLTGAVAILNTQIVTDQGQQKIQIVFPVNSVDGQTGSVNTWGYTNNATTKMPLAAPADIWNLTRDINSGNIGLRFTYDSVNGSRAYLVFSDGINPESALRLLTPADIPSSSGVVSINGQTGVVNLYGHDIQMNSTDNTLVEDAINNNAADITDIQGDITDIQGDVTSIQGDITTIQGDVSSIQGDITTIQGDVTALENVDEQLKADIGIVENTDTATHTIAAGQYVIWKGSLYTASAAIPAGSTLSATNLSPVNNGGLNDIQDAITNIPNTVLSSYNSLIIQTPINGTETVYNTYQGRKFSDFTVIFITVIIGNYIRENVIIPRSTFTGYANTGTSLNYTTGGNNVEIVIKYNSDTSVKMKYNSSASPSVEVRIDALALENK